MPAPILVYHGAPKLYPEVGATAESSVYTAGLGMDAATTTGLGLDTVPAIITPETEGEELGIAAVRFAKPVRLSSLRIVPAGVVHREGVGETDPSSFTAEVFLNVAPSEPVNALVRTTARVWLAPHALDFAIDMPPGTSTRLVIVRAPAKKITMSLYAHDDAETVGSEGEGGTPTAVSAPTALPLPPAKELIAAIPSLATVDQAVRSQALATLTVLGRTSSLLDDILASPSLAVLTKMDGAEAAVRSILGVEDSHFDGCSALLALTRLHSPSSARYPSPESSLALVLKLAQAQQASLHPQAASSLAIVIKQLGLLMADLDESAADQNRLIADHLARSLTAFAVHATARGLFTAIPVPTSRARTVMASLLPLAAEVTAEGYACAPATQQLAEPFLSGLPDDDVLRRAYSLSPNNTPSLAPPSSPSEGTPKTPPLSTPQVTNLHRALSAPSSSLSLTPTSAEILTIVAPHLLASLATAPAPPLGIPSALPSGLSGSASDYAGKVYSAHEFRRERDTVSGLGIGLAGVGRKASRHVDEFR